MADAPGNTLRQWWKDHWMFIAPFVLTALLLTVSELPDFVQGVRARATAEQWEREAGQFVGTPLADLWAWLQREPGVSASSRGFGVTGLTAERVYTPGGFWTGMRVERLVVKHGPMTPDALVTSVEASVSSVSTVLAMRRAPPIWYDGVRTAVAMLPLTAYFVMAAMGLRRLRRRDQGRCPRCGYPHRGETRCPECGKPYAPPDDDAIAAQWPVRPWESP